MKKKFKWSLALRKGLIAAAAVGTGVLAGAETLAGVNSLGKIGAVAGIGAVVTAIRAGINWWKVNADLADGVPPR